MPFTTRQPAYQRLRKIHSERLKPVVFWVGAGLSQPAGLPGWLGLRDKLYKMALEIAAVKPEKEGAASEAALERAISTNNLWISFQILKKHMGATEFREGIREILAVAHAANPPDLYNKIWDLPGVRGMLTLNIDGFARRAYDAVRHSQHPTEFVGKSTADYAHVIGAGRQFIGNLHGHIDAQSTWVFTKDEISSLVNTPGYREFIGFIFSQMTVVFCGISADDSAAGGFLAALSNLGLDLGSHFWITDRTDPRVFKFSDKAQIGLIRFAPDNQNGQVADYVTPLSELFADMRGYVSRDTVPPPITSTVVPIDALPAPMVLLSKSTDDLRTSLSGYSRKLREAGLQDTDAEYQKFIREYEMCIHQAWWVTSNPPHNVFFSYKVEECISSSPFSNVWRLRADGGEALALKVLQKEKLDGPAEIGSFRRGVQSLIYLTQADIPGTPRLISAFEMPAALLMEFIEGDSLQEIAKARSYSFWADGLPVIQSVCEHLRYGHNLPQAVLHRDVRPSNIIIPNFYWQSDSTNEISSKHDVCLLNYDMSWHAFAKGSTVTGKLEDSGYYAPEYLHNSGESARSTLVDSFGTGMCLFFAATQEKPPPAGSSSVEWLEILNRPFKADTRGHWHSAPIRLRRLIESATSVNPILRPMIDQIEGELSLLRRLVDGQLDGLPADVWAEELICRVEQTVYQAHDGGLSFSRSARAGRLVSVESDHKRRELFLLFKNQAVDSTSWTGIDKRWTEKLQQAKDILSSGGWTVLGQTQYSSKEIFIKASIVPEFIQKNIKKVIESMQRGLNVVKLD